MYNLTFVSLGFIEPYSEAFLHDLRRQRIFRCSKHQKEEERNLLGMNLIGSSIVSSFLKVPKNLIFREGDPLLLDSKDIPSCILDKIYDANVVVNHLIKLAKGHWGLLERYYSDQWLLWRLEPPTEDLQHDQPLLDHHQNSQYKIKTIDEWCRIDIPDLIGFWKEDQYTGHDANEYVGLDFIISPPDKILSSRDTSTLAEVSQDPIQYLNKKYYETLFQLGVPLALFVKSKLSRLKNICKNKQANLYRDVLSIMILDLAEFGGRHDAEHQGLLIYELPSYAAELREKYIINQFHIHNLRDNKGQASYVKDLIMILKARELKLQIILLLEIISLEKMDACFKDFELKYRSNLDKRSLEVTKANPMFRRRRKENQHKATKKKKLDLCEQLDILLDKLTIADILLTTEPRIHIDEEKKQDQTPQEKILELKRNMLNKGKEVSSLGFISYVLVPYWSKRTPNVVAFIIKKIKGPSLQKNLPSSTRSSSLPSEEPSIASRRSSLSSTTNSSCPSSPKTTQLKIASGSSAVNLLNSRTSSNLVEFLESDNSLGKRPSLSRTNSDLSLNRLQKRQLPASDLASMNILRNQVSFDGTSSFTSVYGRYKSTARAVTQSFRRVGKRKLQPMTEDKPVDETRYDIQVTATPIKEAKSSKPVDRLQVIESPVATNTSPAKSLIEIAATPLKRRLSVKQRFQDEASNTVTSSSAPHKVELAQKPELNAEISPIIAARPKHKKVRRRLFIPS
ncbi:Sld3p Ecym_2277 [Eremothecium cymbalariae DBVPG|uniref:DNA replication regulator Sld3 C-terminal domain-containing protein n=1 Tax=Eremothecium cymbalariae (strain CBS 270.75 / DBVPG 7215 / KCTC 17166 / NRRL Y-17582) TaxID=931890 RepID=G8JPR8_ERECY|nr:Hypothetical protein Ecym_2277 [Eremothecium cymbalariae DBVPG\